MHLHWRKAVGEVDSVDGCASVEDTGSGVDSDSAGKIEAGAIESRGFLGPVVNRGLGGNRVCRVF